jgi:hypothetical protein
VDFIEQIDSKEILGAVRVDMDGNIIKGSMEINPTYLSESLDEDIEVAKKFTGG